MDGDNSNLFGRAGKSKAEFASAIRHGERVYLSAANALAPDGAVSGIGDATVQTEAALDQLEAALQSVGGSLRHVTKLTTSVVDRGYRSEVYAAITRRLQGTRVVSTGLVVSGLPLPEMIVQIDAEAAIPDAPVDYTRPYTFENWHGQAFPWAGAMVIATADEFFVRGQTGSGLDHSGIKHGGRRVVDAEAQVELAMSNLATVLEDAGADPADIVKISFYVSDRAYWNVAQKVMRKHLGRFQPTCSGIVTTGFARPDILFEIDVTLPRRREGRDYRRVAAGHWAEEKTGSKEDFSVMVVADDIVALAGQTGVALDGTFHCRGDAVAQAEQAMTNIETLLREAGAGLMDVVKATVYVTDRAHLDSVHAVVMQRLGDAAPTLSLGIVKGLSDPDHLVEIDVSAVRGATHACFMPRRANG